MSYPLIIFGAGASHDYSSLGRNVSPLTKDLVADHFLHPDLLQKYRGAGDILMDILPRVRANTASFEDVLTEIRETSKNSVQMRAHFVGLEFFLKALFARVSNPSYHGALSSELRQRMHQMNNYQVILNRIHTYSGGRAVVVSFNYDSLFEDSLPGIVIGKMQDYIAKDIKIIKPHGSHNWSYIYKRAPLGISRAEESSVFQWCLENADELERLIKKEGAQIYHTQEVRGHSAASEYAQFPAIAIPLVGKDQYVCPPNHVTTLEKELPNIDRVIVD